MFLVSRHWSNGVDSWNFPVFVTNDKQTAAVFCEEKNRGLCADMEHYHFAEIEVR